MKHMTAVDWLQKAIRLHMATQLGPTYLELFEQAKQLEKEQLIETFNQGALDGLQLGEQYYKEVFQS